MSVEIMGLIWKMDADPIEKLILLSYADYSNIDGVSIYPSNETTSRRTGINERSVRRVNRRLEAAGYLVLDGKSRYRTNEYRLNLENITANIAARSAQVGDVESGIDLPESAEGDVESASRGTQSPVKGDAESANPLDYPLVNPLDSAGVEIESFEIFEPDSVPDLRKSENGSGNTREDDYKQRITEAIARGQAKYNLSKVDLSRYPEDVREIISVISERFSITPPAGKKPSGDWIQSAREVLESCGELGVDLVKAYADRYFGIAELTGSVPHTVARPGSLVNPLRGYLAEIITTGEFESRAPGKRSRGKSPIEFVK